MLEHLRWRHPVSLLRLGRYPRGGSGLHLRRALGIVLTLIATPSRRLVGCVAAGFAVGLLVRSLGVVPAGIAIATFSAIVVALAQQTLP